MKTTLEIDDDLYRQTKAVAALRGQKVRDLVNEGLRLVLGRPVRRPPATQVLGCLRRELGPKSVAELMESLRGPVELPPADTSNKKR